MNDINEKFDKLIYEAEFLYDYLDEKTYLGDDCFIDEDLKKYESIRKCLQIFIKELNNIVMFKKKKTKETYLKYQKEFDDIYNEFVVFEATSTDNLAIHKYANNEELLLNNTKRILDKTDINDLKNMLKDFKKTAKENMCCIMLLGPLEIEYRAIDKLYKNTTTHAKFLDLLIDKIEQIIPNSKVRKSIQQEKIKILDSKTVISEADIDDFTEDEKKETKTRRKKTTNKNLKSSPVNITNYTMPLYQTSVINSFLGMSYKESDIKKGGTNHLSIFRDDLSNNITLDNNNVKAIINLQEFNNLVLDAKAKKTLCILLSMLSRKIPNNRYLNEEEAVYYKNYTIKIKDYMNYTGLKDNTNAKKQLNESLNALLCTKIFYTYNDKKEGIKHKTINILSASEYVPNRSKFNISFSTDFIEHLTFRSTLMKYNENLLTINDRLFPSGFSLGHKLLVYARSNEHKPNKLKDNKYCIKIAELLKVCTFNDNDRHSFSERILDKFENTLEELVKLKVIDASWEYCGKGRRSLTDEELNITRYEDFIQLYLLYKVYDN